jgi:hypothetical protein
VRLITRFANTNNEKTLRNAALDASVSEDAHSKELFNNAIEFQSKLSDGDRKVFDATINLIPVPQS